MAIPTEKAYETLNLPLGASKDAIEQSYKKLAFKWHPEKYTTNKNTQEALKVSSTTPQCLYDGFFFADFHILNLFEAFLTYIKDGPLILNMKAELKERLNFL